MKPRLRDSLLDCQLAWMDNCMLRDNGYNPLPNACKSISLSHSLCGMSAFQQWRHSASWQNADRMREESIRNEVVSDALSRNDEESMKLTHLLLPSFSKITYRTIPTCNLPKTCSILKTDHKRKRALVLPLHPCAKRRDMNELKAHN